MRYFLLCLAAFVLLAVPAFAVNQAQVDITVNVPKVCDFTVQEIALVFDLPNTCWPVTDPKIYDQILHFHVCCNTAGTLAYEWLPAANWPANLALTMPDFGPLAFGAGYCHYYADAGWTVRMTATWPVAPAEAPNGYTGKLMFTQACS